MKHVHVIGVLVLALAATGCGKDREKKTSGVRAIDTLNEHATGTEDEADPVVTISITAAPGAALDQGASFQFAAKVNGAADKGVVWSTVGGGSISAGGLFAAPAAGGQITVVATAKADSTKKAEAKVTVNDVTVTAAGPAVVFVDETADYSGTVAGTALGTGIAWSVEGDGDVGSIDANGHFTPNAGRGEYTATVVATSMAAPGKSAQVAIIVALRPVITISASATNLLTGAAASFAASVSDGTPGVTWSVLEGAAGGSIDAGGNYTAPAGGGTFHIVATHAQYPAASASFEVIVCTAFDGIVSYFDPGTQPAADDDTVTQRVRLSYGDLEAHTTYEGLQASWLELAADDVLSATTYSGAGDDDTWFTADDAAAAFFSLAADESGRQSGYARHGTAGADGVFGTADDEILERGAIVRDASGYVQEVTRYTGPGLDGTWGTADDTAGGFTTYVRDVTGNVLTSYTLNGARNIQGYRVYENDAAGRPLTVTSFTHPGTGNVWEDGNDRFNRKFRYVYDASGRVTARTEQVFNGPSNTPQPQNDTRVTYTYTDAGNLPAEMTRYGAGGDNLIGNEDDDVGAFARRNMMCPW